MGLKPIKPFNYEQYCSEILDFPEWMVEYVQRNRINNCIGWVKHFEEYNYNGGTWKEGVEKRLEFHDKLRREFNCYEGLNSSTRSTQNLVTIANEVLHWGFRNPIEYKAEDGVGIFEALEVLCGEATDTEWDENIVKLINFVGNHRVASHSKIYEMFEPKQWTIYDSRVSIALACLVHHYWAEKGHQPGLSRTRIRFPIAGAQGPRHPYPDEFPSLGYADQGARAFIYASWLLRRVAEILRSSPAEYGCLPTDDNWQVYHIEMALFMMGAKDF